MRTWHTMFAAALLSTSACWSLATEVPDVTGGSLDGGTDTSVADVEAREGGPLEDSTVAAEGDAPQATFCSTVPKPVTLCDDFEAAPFGASWTPPFTTDSGGTIARDDAMAKAGTYSFLASTPTGATDPAGRLLHVASNKPARVVLEFDLLIGVPQAAASAHLLAGVAIELPGAKFYRADIGLQSGFRVFEARNDGPAGSTQGTSTFDATNWAHVVIDMNLTPGSGHVVVTADGVQQLDVPIAAPEPSAAKTTMSLGIYTGPPFPTDHAASFRFDNVVYRLTPR